MAKGTLFAGKLDRRVILNIPGAESQSASGAVVRGAGTSILVWAAYEGNIGSNASEGVKDMALVSKSYVYFVIRYREIGNDYTLTYNGMVYNIEGSEEVGRRDKLRLRCELIS